MMIYHGGMTICTILMQPKGLRAENEALETNIKTIETLLPESPFPARLRACIKRNEELIEEMETWVSSIPDAFIRDTIRTYQACGDWSKTNLRQYGYPSYHTCRSAVLRYLRKTDFMERFG